MARLFPFSPPWPWFVKVFLLFFAVMVYRYQWDDKICSGIIKLALVESRAWYLIIFQSQTETFGMIWSGLSDPRSLWSWYIEGHGESMSGFIATRAGIGGAKNNHPKGTFSDCFMLTGPDGNAPQDAVDWCWRTYGGNLVVWSLAFGNILFFCPWSAIKTWGMGWTR